MRGLSEHREAVLTLPVEQLMTREVMTCSSEEPLVDLMKVMTLQRVRHLPVVRNGTIEGIVSIGDVVKQRLGELQYEVEMLNDYLRSP
jgi:CBS domain-containing protein